jgi:hypothetical protein
VAVVHTYNPSYSGDRDQKDRGLRQPGQIVLKNLSGKNTIIKRKKKEWLKL